MGLYGTYLYPRLMEWALSSETCAVERRRALATARGEVLEIGFGTGLNLPHYPPTVTHLTILDSAAHVPARVAARIKAASFPITTTFLDAERLPFDDDHFDTVTSTWTLCSIPDPVAALREIRRVLRPDGRFLFLEHGLSADPAIQRWQHLWNPVQRVIGCGCNVNRPIDEIVAASGLSTTELTRFVLPDEIRMMAAMYRGVAVRG
jgi:ubiquinone/menaquinone biosynthesis C-methylase UbiE